MMFDQTFVDGTGKTNKSWTVAVSCVAEFAVVGIMVLIPLIWTEVLPRAQQVNALTAPAPPPAPVPPVAASAPVARQPHSAPRVFKGLETPRRVPQQIAIINEDVALTPAYLGEPGILVAGPAAVGPAAFPGGVNITPPPVSAAPKAEVKPRQEALVQVGGDVQNAKLIKHPAPTYPSIAVTARIQGAVVLQAIIGKDGTVRDLKVVSAASPLLVRSAMDAVKQWTYSPTLLNREPVEVITEITVNFALR
jgi:protein TonB